MPGCCSRVEAMSHTDDLRKRGVYVSFPQFRGHGGYREKRNDKVRGISVL